MRADRYLSSGVEPTKDDVNAVTESRNERSLSKSRTHEVSKSAAAAAACHAGCKVSLVTARSSSSRRLGRVASTWSLLSSNGLVPKGEIVLVPTVYDVVSIPVWCEGCVEVESCASEGTGVHKAGLVRLRKKRCAEQIGKGSVL
jgi:hypothetical protein